MNEFWQGMSRRRRIGFGVGLTAILGATIALGLWLLRTDYEVLFANLSAPDAAAMTGELDRMKTPYRLGADGTSILVDRSTVHATRLKLMGKDLPLHGAVGFELFNNSDFGMTEFAQKINYQRALQGEITRTILSLAEVESARVHLAFPEESLFRRDQAKAKASIALALRHGQSLRPEQVSGIQRLVSAAVTGIAPGDVTIINQEGVALTRVVATDTPADVSTRLELKSEVEQALARKVNRVLERTFGEGRVLASVDVALDMNQVRITTEDVRGQTDRPGETPTGVIVRERETLRDESTAMVSARDGTAGGSSFRETEYQVGRRVEQVIGQPGSIQRLQVVAVVKDALDATQAAQVKALISASVGAVAERGDTVIVHSQSLFEASRQVAELPGSSADASGDAEASATPDSRSRARYSAFAVWVSSERVTIAIAGLAVLAAVVASGLIVVRRRGLPVNGALSPAEREAAMTRVRRWMNEGPERAAAAPEGAA